MQTAMPAPTGTRAALSFIFVMVMLDKLEDPGITTASYVATRMLEVTAGTAACVIVSTVSAVTLRRVWPAERTPAPGEKLAPPEERDQQEQRGDEEDGKRFQKPHRARLRSAQDQCCTAVSARTVTPSPVTERNPPDTS